MSGLTPLVCASIHFGYEDVRANALSTHYFLSPWGQSNGRKFAVHDFPKGIADEHSADLKSANLLFTLISPFSP